MTHYDSFGDSQQRCGALIAYSSRLDGSRKGRGMPRPARNPKDLNGFSDRCKKAVLASAPVCMVKPSVSVPM